MSTSIARRVRNMVVAIPWSRNDAWIDGYRRNETVPTAAVPLGGRPCILIDNLCRTPL